MLRIIRKGGVCLKIQYYVIIVQVKFSRGSSAMKVALGHRYGNVNQTEQDALQDVEYIVVE